MVKNVSFYANYARSWAQSAGNFTGGFIPLSTSPNYFYDDHDQTDTASFGVSFKHAGLFWDIDGEYGSGFRYGDNGTQVNYLRTEPHLIFDTSAGATTGHSALAFSVINVLNHPYIITEGGVFSQQQWGQARTYGMKYTYNF